MDLLDYLTTLLRCEYLSDLNNAHITPKEIETLRGLGDSCPLEEYNRALSYLTRHTAAFVNLSDARDALIAFLTRKDE